MYVNPHMDKQYAFMRGNGKEILLITANFSDSNEIVELNIPAAALDYLRAKRGKYKAKELLSKKDISLNLSEEKSAKFTVPANSGVILKIVF